MHDVAGLTLHHVGRRRRLKADCWPKGMPIGKGDAAENSGSRHQNTKFFQFSSPLFALIWR